jgi:hypothetical protein
MRGEHTLESQYRNDAARAIDKRVKKFLLKRSRVYLQPSQGLTAGSELLGRQ